MKKKDLDGKRGSKAKNPDSGEGSDETSEKSALDDDTVAYVRSVTCLIEGRRVSRKEIEEMLERVMRQHSLSFGKKKDYIQRNLKNNPP